MRTDQKWESSAEHIGVPISVHSDKTLGSGDHDLTADKTHRNHNNVYFQVSYVLSRTFY